MYSVPTHGTHLVVAIGADDLVPQAAFAAFPSEATVLKLARDGWMERKGFVITLPRLLRMGFMRGSFTLKELYYWWLHAPKIAKRRQHAWMSVE